MDLTSSVKLHVRARQVS